jgi:hypothetical protein
MSTEQLRELEGMGPIDYVILEWPHGRPEGGEVAPLIVDLVDRGIIRVLDIAFIAKAPDGSVTALDLDNLDGEGGPFQVFAGASSGLLDFEDVQEAGAAMDPGTSAAVLIWENRWMAPVADALRRSGGQLVGSGRIPAPAILEALDALEAIH